MLLQHKRGAPEDAQPSPVAYMSRALSKTERGYDTGKREGLALAWAVKRWRHYVQGTDFALRTDHKNLTWILQAEHTVDPQYARWKAGLAPYASDLEHDKDVAVADALSRDPRWEHVDRPS